MYKPTFLGKRYLTRGVLATIEPIVQFSIWDYLVHFVQTHPQSIDYLQIFHLVTEERGGQLTLVIHHEQEEPPIIQKNVLRFPVTDPVKEKIYVISDWDERGKEYATMLLASEY